MALNACFDRLKPLLQWAQSPSVYLTNYRTRRPCNAKTPSRQDATALYHYPPFQTARVRGNPSDRSRGSAGLPRAAIPFHWRTKSRRGARSRPAEIGGQGVAHAFSPYRRMRSCARHCPGHERGMALLQHDAGGSHHREGHSRAFRCALAAIDVRRIGGINTSGVSSGRAAASEVVPRRRARHTGCPITPGRIAATDFSARTPALERP